MGVSFLAGHHTLAFSVTSFEMLKWLLTKWTTRKDSIVWKRFSRPMVRLSFPKSACQELQKPLSECQMLLNSQRDTSILWFYLLTVMTVWTKQTPPVEKTLQKMTCFFWCWLCSFCMRSLGPVVRWLVISQLSLGNMLNSFFIKLWVRVFRPPINDATWWMILNFQSTATQKEIFGCASLEHKCASPFFLKDCTKYITALWQFYLPLFQIYSIPSFQGWHCFYWVENFQVKSKN